VRNAVHDSVSKAANRLQHSLDTHEHKVDAVQRRLERAQRLNAAAVMTEAKRKANLIIKHAKRENAVATAAAALSKTNTAVLKKIGSVAHAALGDIRDVDLQTEHSTVESLKDAQLKQQVQQDQDSIEHSGSKI